LLAERTALRRFFGIFVPDPPLPLPRARLVQSFGNVVDRLANVSREDVRDMKRALCGAGHSLQYRFGATNYCGLPDAFDVLLARLFSRFAPPKK
jgi:hypothetical protein